MSNPGDFNEELDLFPPVVVGSIFSCSWGYDQTNIDFFKVVKLMPKSVRVVQIGSMRAEDSHPHDHSFAVVPNINAERGKPMTKRVNKGWRGKAGLTISSFQYASLWDGTPKHETNSLYGH